MGGVTFSCPSLNPDLILLLALDAHSLCFATVSFSCAGYQKCAEAPVSFPNFSGRNRARTHLLMERACMSEMGFSEFYRCWLEVAVQ